MIKTILILNGLIILFELVNANPLINPNLFEGDILLPLKSTSVGKQRTVATLRAFKWPKGIVPYALNESLFTEIDRNIILTAIVDLQQRINVNGTEYIRFVPRTNEINHITFVRDFGCSSYVGLINAGAQFVSLARGCVFRGIVQHELLHAIGFFHEQSRPDRDEYVTVFFENIDPSMVHNFQKYTTDVSVYGLPYDYNSLMHYDPFAFSNNGRPVILPKQPNVFIGNREAPSPLDLEAVRRHYASEISIVSSTTPSTTTTTVPVVTTTVPVVTTTVPVVTTTVPVVTTTVPVVTTTVPVVTTTVPVVTTTVPVMTTTVPVVTTTKTIPFANLTDCLLFRCTMDSHCKANSRCIKNRCSGVRNVRCDVNGTIYRGNSRRDKYYTPFNVNDAYPVPALNWFDAKIKCESLGARLLIVRDRDEFEFLKTLMRSISKMHCKWCNNNDFHRWIGAYVPISIIGNNRATWIDGRIAENQTLFHNPTGGACFYWDMSDPDQVRPFKGSSDFCMSTQPYICKF